MKENTNDHKKSISRRDFMKSFAVCATGIAVSDLYAVSENVKSTRKPNIIVILADDLGYGDVGFLGCKDIPTPNIDLIANEGVKFTSGYVSCPVCSPTRAGLMTGRYQQRFGHWYNPSPDDWALENEYGLPPSETTMADVLKKAGYATGIVGKWHLGPGEKFHPLNRGFDYFFGFQGMHSYLKPYNKWWDYNNPIVRNKKAVEPEEYLTDVFTDEALGFIERHSKEPFFLYLPYNAPHLPLEAPEKYISHFDHIKHPKRKVFAAMVYAMDQGIGKILTKLRQLNIEEDTLVFFLSDNGGRTMSAGAGARNEPLRGDKGTFYEGGIRIPFAMRWKGHLSSGKTYNYPVISLDIFSTAAYAAGASLPKNRIIDGVNLLPYINCENDGQPHSSLYWRWRNLSAILHDGYKLIKFNENQMELYYLPQDIEEANDLCKEKPQVTSTLKNMLNQWASTLSEPLWPSPGREQWIEAYKLHKQRLEKENIDK